jgi:putative salt-induced outer membrane protein YdiY
MNCIAIGSKRSAGFLTGVAALRIAVFVGTVGVAYGAQDVVITTTGDRLVGEIKSVEKDVLILETDYSDSDFKIKWEKIASIQSERQFVVETFDGKRVSGSLKPDPAQKTVMQVADTSVKLPDVSVVQPFERNFWARFDTGLDFGYSMTRTNSAEQLSLGANVAYRDEHRADALFVSVFRNAQENAPETQRWELGNDFRRLLGTRWYVNTTQDFLNTEEQGLDLRTTIGGGAGRYLARSSSQYLSLGTGLAWTDENYTNAAEPTKDSAEAYLGAAFMTEKLKITDLTTQFTYYPSLTISDRYRLTYRFDLDFNLPGDWYFRVGLFDNYDSKPPSGFSRNDYGWSNAFGFKF